MISQVMRNKEQPNHYSPSQKGQRIFTDPIFQWMQKNINKIFSYPINSMPTCKSSPTANKQIITRPAKQSQRILLAVSFFSPYFSSITVLFLVSALFSSCFAVSESSAEMWLVHLYKTFLPPVPGERHKS